MIGIILLIDFIGEIDVILINACARLTPPARPSPQTKPLSPPRPKVPKGNSWVAGSWRVIRMYA